MALNERQRRFVEAYNGNATEAALAAGYSARSAASIGNENLKKPEIARAIKEREAMRVKPLIATREDRQRFWTKVMNDEGAEMKDRLRASELLGKAAGDFLDRVELAGSGGGPVTFQWAGS